MPGRKDALNLSDHLAHVEGAEDAEGVHCAALTEVDDAAELFRFIDINVQ